MAQYRKKPVVIEAIQYKGYMTDEVNNFIGDSLISESRWGDEGGPVGYFIKTLEGTSYMLDKNDYIIRGVKGEFYPCKPDIFEMTYELVNEQDNELDDYSKSILLQAYGLPAQLHWDIVKLNKVDEKDFLERCIKVYWEHYANRVHPDNEKDWNTSQNILKKND